MSDNLKVRITKGTRTLIRLGAVIGAITVIAGGYTFYLNNLWKPDVAITFVDFNIGYAEFIFNGKKYILEGDAVVLLAGDWGIRFGTKLEEDKLIYKSIILSKKGMLVDILKR